MKRKILKQGLWISNFDHRMILHFGNHLHLLNQIHCAMLETLWTITLMLADNSKNSSSLIYCSNSTIYKLNRSECVSSSALNESTKSDDFSLTQHQ